MNFVRAAKKTVRRRAPGTALGTLIAITFASTRALGAPTGGAVRSGTASVSQAGDVTTVTQSSQQASIDWQSFSVGTHESVNFEQPSAASVTLNRVVGNEPSVIEGALNANGQVFLINASGVLFAKGSQVNTAGLVASTLDISEADFKAGNYTFAGKSQGSVKNQGTLSAKDQGYVALLGKNVTNDGVIVATRGTVALASGDKVTLNFDGTSLFGVSVDEGTLNALVENQQAISADGGKVFLTAKAADELLSAQVNNTGVIQARTLGDLTGTIDLHAYGGTAEIAGRLDASAPAGGRGGFIETSGDSVHVADSAGITTFAPNGQSGTWLIDPNGYTVAASGGDITGATLSNNLKSGNIEIQASKAEGSDGNIYVNDAVKWSSDTTLTLTATNDIYINRSITAEGENAGLALNFGKTGDYHILTPASFSGAVLDASGKPVISAGGLIGTIDGVAARLILRNSYATGDVTASPTLQQGLGEGGVGGLIGRLPSKDNLIQDSFATGNVTVESGIGLARVGGLVGLVGDDRDDFDVSLQIKNSYATGVVAAPSQNMVGGLVGKATGNILIDGSYATGDVTAWSAVGGLVGSSSGTIQNSWSAGKVTARGGQDAGGLVGAGNVSLVNNYWDSEKNPADAGSSVPASDTVHGLPSDKIRNAPYYIEGKEPPVPNGRGGPRPGRSL